MSILKKIKDKCVTLYQKSKNRAEIAKERTIQYVLVAVAAMLPFSAAHANDAAGTLTQLGTQIAGLIALFAGVVTAIGMAAISVIVLIQGFRMAFGMTKLVK
ncbi:hypothetical protein MIS46_10560 [Wielerella bovis]|uniref:hypothetical protein n=1 Tax=Wielerella bovis TaxID=2917790 RepID=UPI00201A13BD|nr:hypothetical protein [Wielerella bovis]ULJ62380.1 hypothetical protein MIS46_10560 [Wielerella bovis]